MKLIIRFLILVLISNACTKLSEIEITNLKCEYKINPVGIDISKPRFSWNLESVQRGIGQSAYQLFVSSSLKNLDEDRGDIWDSKKIDSDQSIQIYFNGSPLESNQKYFWKVRVWDQDGSTHTSEPRCCPLSRKQANYGCCSRLPHRAASTGALLIITLITPEPSDNVNFV